MKVNAAPFPLGKTFYDGGTIDTNDLKGGHLLGMRCEHLNLSDVSGVQPKLSEAPLISVLVRNNAGIALEPKRLVVWETRFKSVDGYSSTTAVEVAGVVDPFLPSTGVPNGDIFHLLVDGPVLIKSQLSTLGANVSAGDLLYAITAATSQATTAGRFTAWGGTFSLTQTTDGTEANVIRNAIGRAMSALTTGNTNTDTLVDLQLHV